MQGGVGGIQERGRTLKGVEALSEPNDSQYAVTPGSRHRHGLEVFGLCCEDSDCKMDRCLTQYYATAWCMISIRFKFKFKFQNDADCPPRLMLWTPRVGGADWQDYRAAECKQCHDAKCTLVVAPFAISHPMNTQPCADPVMSI